MRTFGLVGFPLGHSFSPLFFQKKFAEENVLDASYRLFPLEDIAALPRLIAQNRSLAGFNVTIPYKESIVPYLDELGDTAREIGAVNVVKVLWNNESPYLIGHNTDADAFLQSLREFMPVKPQNALILGTGGASKAVAYALRKEGVKFRSVSRTKKLNCLTYKELNEEVIRHTDLIVNATPVGMSPRADELPDLPYEFLTPGHSLFDLIYNPEETAFLQAGGARDARTCNGLRMLHLQAEASWAIWADFG